MNAYKLKDFCRHIYREYFELVHAYKMNVYNHTESAVTCFENILGVKIRHTLLINWCEQVNSMHMHDLDFG